MHWFKAGTCNDQRYIPIHVVASELGLPIHWLLPAMHAGWNSGSSFPHIRKMTTFQTLKRKIDELTNMIDFGDSPHFPYKVCLLLLQFNMYVVFMKKINQVQVLINYDIECLPKSI